MSPFNINKVDGAIEIGEFKISPDTRLEEFQASKHGKDLKPIIINPPWQTFRIQASPAVICNIVFENTRMREVRLYIIDSSLASWSNWNRCSQEKAKQRHDNALQSTLGESALTCSWGSIESVQDARDGVSQIMIKFK